MRRTIIGRMAGNPLRELPSVDHVLASERVQALVTRHGRPVVLDAVRAALERGREEVQAGYEGGDVVERPEREL